MSAFRIDQAIQGLPEIKQRLKKLKAETVTKINRSASRAGAREIEKQADSRLPGGHRSKKKLGIERSRRESKRGLEVWRIGPKIENWALLFFEFGAKAHDITPKKKKALTIPFEGQRWGAPVVDYFTKRVKNPGIRPTRFLSRSILQGSRNAIDKIGKQYWKRIRKIAERGN